MQTEKAQKAADEEKRLGNDAFQARNYEEAVKHFTNAIECDPYNHVLFSNRSAAYASLCKYDEALADADKTVKLRPSWVKGYSRKATALFFLGRHKEAAAAYAAGLEYEPNNETLRQGLASLNEEIEKQMVEPPKEGQRPQQGSSSQALRLPKGVYVPMITPFTLKNKIDWTGIDLLVEHYVQKGAAGIFLLAECGEAFELAPDERVRIVRRAAKAVDGRVKVIAVGNFGTNVDEQADGVRRTHAAGADLVLLSAPLLARSADSDDSWKNNCRRLIDAVPDVPLGLYEGHRPYRRALAPEMWKWAVDAGRMAMLIDSGDGRQSTQHRLQALRDRGDARYIVGNVATMLHCVGLGADGFCSVAVNVYPDLFVWLMEHHGRAAQQASVLQRFLTLADLTVAQKFPLTAKAYLRLFEKGFKGLEIPSRVAGAAAMMELGEDDIHRLNALHELLEFARQELKRAEKHGGGSKAEGVLL